MPNKDNSLKLLVIAEDIAYPAPTASVLRDNGYEPERVHTLEEGRRSLVKQPHFTAVLIGVSFTEDDLREMIVWLRERSTVPILLLDCPGGRERALRLLASGADDYVCSVPEEDEPDGFQELLVRLASCIRVANRSPTTASGELAFGDVRLELDKQRVTRGAEEIPLTQMEYDLLVALMRQPEALVSTQDLLEQVWGSKRTEQRSYVRIYIHRLRRKLGWEGSSGPRIETLRGRGYRLTSSAAAKS